jgi:hypothetical protein
LNFVRNMVWSTPLVMAATLAGTNPFVAADPAASRVAALIVDDTITDASEAEADCWDRTTASAPPERLQP